VYRLLEKLGPSESSAAWQKICRSATRRLKKSRRIYNWAQKETESAAHAGRGPYPQYWFLYSDPEYNDLLKKLGLPETTKWKIRRAESGPRGKARTN
jgi:hypothetical protein